LHKATEQNQISCRLLSLSSQPTNPAMPKPGLGNLLIQEESSKREQKSTYVNYAMFAELEILKQQLKMSLLRLVDYANSKTANICGINNFKSLKFKKPLE
jgi:hypothetical protein